MGKQPKLGSKIYSPPEDLIHVVVGDLSRKVEELSHAPEPLGSIEEIVASFNDHAAASRYLNEMEDRGTSPREIIERMNRLTPFTRIRIKAEFAELPPGTALKATTPSQERICMAALQLARCSDVEGFTLFGTSEARRRLLMLKDAIPVAIEIVGAPRFAPVHLLPPNSQELYKFGR
jgi:hypothetical protein